MSFSVRTLALTAAVVAGVQAVPADAAAQQFDPSLFGSLEWENVGPSRGGRSTAVAGSASRPYEYYFGATGG
ncbi:MAG TPA: hypothetical protein VJ997_03720, partial [Longimicrobiales bacterium]|nr:hypothetical protein [Longimicrobiales bacterium]